MSDQEQIQDRPDGFRPRRKRPAGWLKAAIKDGSVRDPSLPPEPEQVYPEDAVVVRPPTATIKQEEGN